MNKNLNYIKNTIKQGLNEFKIGTKTMFKEFFNKDTNKKQRANMWTFLRLIIPLITIITSIIAVSISSPILFLTTGLIAGFGAVTDYFDGKSSRKHNSASKYGKLLDQISDKVFAGIIGINLLFINFNYIFVLLGELLIAAVNIGYKLKYNNMDITSTKAGKIKEWPLFITLALGFLSPISPALLTISNISILLTTLFQLKTAESYIVNNSKEANSLKRQKNIESTITIEEEKNEGAKELTPTKENQNTKLEQYKDLRNVLNEIIELKNNNEELEISDYQKRKELN